MILWTNRTYPVLPEGAVWVNRSGAGPWTWVRQDVPGTLAGRDLVGLELQAIFATEVGDDSIHVPQTL